MNRGGTEAAIPAIDLYFTACGGPDARFINSSIKSRSLIPPESFVAKIGNKCFLKNWIHAIAFQCRFNAAYSTMGKEDTLVRTSEAQPKIKEARFFYSKRP
jgi:hypothetical protein